MEMGYKHTITNRFKMLGLWKKIGVIGSLVTIASACISFLFFMFSDENKASNINNSVINSNGVINNSIVIFPVTSESAEVKEENYSPEAIIKSVILDSVDHSKSSAERILARSVHGFYFTKEYENNILFSGITPFKLEKVGAIFGPDYRVLGLATDLDEHNKTVRINITAISMIDNYGNAFEIRSKKGKYIGYAESLDKITQQIVSLEKTDSGLQFNYGKDVQIILEYNKEDVELVGKVR